ncbi:MAG: hypothetical protein KAR20_28950 [Candidatus Heimdallarchaeota archaeon]|nr:hypothetical protein [Candidatus Heimdallarchaeota archaeon]
MMKKTDNSKQVDTGRKNKKVYIIIFSIILIIIVGFVVFRLMNPVNPISKDPNFEEHGGFTFIRLSDGLWYTQLQSPHTGELFNVPFRYSPSEVKDVLIDREVPRAIVNSDLIYLTTDPDSSSSSVVAMLEIGRILGTTYGIMDIPTGSALTAWTGENDDFPVITCANATSLTRVVLFEESDKTMAYVNKDCIIFSGKDGDDLIRVADKVTFILLGII